MSNLLPIVFAIHDRSDAESDIAIQAFCDQLEENGNTFDRNECIATLKWWRDYMRDYTTNPEWLNEWKASINQ